MIRRCWPVVPVLLLIAACDTLERKSRLVGPGDSRYDVRVVMGPPGDRQTRGGHEAWQYRETNGEYQDFRVIWFYEGRVTGITSYRNDASTSGADPTRFRPIDWSDAP